jgi:hypothetical protein
MLSLQKRLWTCSGVSGKKNKLQLRAVVNLFAKSVSQD